MNIIIKGHVKGDIIGDGGVKNETHYHYSDEHTTEQQTSETHVSAITKQDTTGIVHDTPAPSRQGIVDALMDLIDKGAWEKGVSAEDVKAGMQNLLNDEHSDAMWQLLENGRGDRLRVLWQNMIGYFTVHGMLPANMSSPALNKMFFGDKDKYDNINKGKHEDEMSNGFRDVLPLLNKHFHR
ncbi:MAG: hypothetical protein K2J86_02705 [Prevotella sp.]|nr:hypothetical protein [Prevotella sp.]